MKITNKQNDKVQCVEFRVASFGKAKVIALEPIKEVSPKSLEQMQISVQDSGNTFHYDLLLTPSEVAIIRKFLIHH